MMRWCVSKKQIVNTAFLAVAYGEVLITTATTVVVVVGGEHAVAQRVQRTDDQVGLGRHLMQRAQIGGLRGLIQLYPLAFQILVPIVGLVLATQGVAETACVCES